jgi:aromatic ring hydroxylase
MPILYPDAKVYMAHEKQMVHIRHPRSHHWHLRICPADLFTGVRHLFLQCTGLNPSQHIHLQVQESF